MSMSAIAARAAALLLTSEKGRKGVGFLLVAIFAPVILIAAILCSATSGGADHNNLAVEASFYGTSFTDSVPAEFQTHITDMQTAFSLLDSAVAEANANMKMCIRDSIYPYRAGSPRGLRTAARGRVQK